MAFNDLPPQTSIHERADAYGVESLRQSRAVAERVRCRLDVPYGEDYWQKMDIYLPADEAAVDVPVLLFFHGGNFTHGYKEWCGFMAPPIIELPAIFVSVSYRLRPEVPYPASIHDAFAALAWVKTHIKELGGDPERVFAGGHSAGGQIVALMALRPDWSDAAGLGPKPLQAVFPLSGTFTQRMIDVEADHCGEPRSLASDSPLELVGNAKIPFFIAWGAEERDPVRDTGRQMADALARHGTPFEWMEIAGTDHFTVHSNTGRPDDVWTKTVRQWMLKR